ncbi:D-lactate dehydrogenase [Chitinophaga sp. CF118]|uniref:2-hydroxyacid dehydrogenase n=1 Tax=Chitinophaga sp. CF118 TaxID=1884367 RepID=UPI0008E7EB29|nr:2-hydroxyacid dehydrogenase [Chitinophaga sp. CF118]SFE16753.1 D-lactate dehydrogenase [Chitinophaga sp. CF118]
MKAVAYSIKSFEKAFLDKANQKKHDITLTTDTLGSGTAIHAKDKEAVIVFTNDDVSANVIDKLAALGIKYIITRSTGTDHICKEAADKHGIKLFNVPSYSPQAIAEHAVALAFALNRKLIKSDQHSHRFDFRNDELIGFNFSGKTVGLIGLGNTGLAVARIYNGLGCKVIGFDLSFPENDLHIQPVTLETLLASSDVISLHLPLTPSTRYLINKNTLDQMKDGVMLINTSRGALLKTIDVIEALKTGKIGYLGLDVYEYEKGLFFEDHENDLVKDSLLQYLMKYSNVLVTPHQAYLTKEALQEIADQTIRNLDLCK